MTTVLPPGPMRTTMSGNPTPLSNRVSDNGNSADFAALLKSEVEGGNLLAQGGEEPGTIPLRERIAEIFNEFGFFQPGPGALADEAPADAPQQIEEAVQTGRQKFPGEGGETEIRTAESIPSRAASGRLGPIAEIEPPGLAMTGVGGFGRPVSSLPVPAEAREPDQSVPEAGRLEFSRIPLVGMKPLALQTGSSAMAALTGDAEGAASAGRPATSERSAEDADRIAFRIGHHGIELIARLEKLGDDEEKRLIEALSALLETHGLSLASATINGRSFLGALKGGQV